MSLNADVDLSDLIVMLSLRNRTLLVIHTGVHTDCRTAVCCHDEFR